MRVLTILLLAFLGISLKGFAENQKKESAIILNCAEEVSEENVIHSLAQMANGNSEGIEVKSLKEGIEKGADIVEGGDGGLKAPVSYTAIKDAKILAIKTLHYAMKSYCAVLEGEVVARGQYPEGK